MQVIGCNRNPHWFLNNLMKPLTSFLYFLCDEPVNGKLQSYAIQRKKHIKHFKQMAHIRTRYLTKWLCRAELIHRAPLGKSHLGCWHAPRWKAIALLSDVLLKYFFTFFFQNKKNSPDVIEHNQTV